MSVRLRLGCAACLLGAAGTVAVAQVSLPGANVTRSVSGRFIILGSAGSPLASAARIVTNADYVQLEPALLAVSAERIRDSLDHKLKPELRDLAPLLAPPRGGKIYLALHPAQIPDETVTIVSRPSRDGWNYEVQLPDVLTRTRYLRAMTGVLLLQTADRGSGHHGSVEVPDWLVDGLSQELLAANWQELVLSSPARTVNGQASRPTIQTTRGMDTLAGARAILRDHAPLTFAQLSWPTAVQLEGNDGGVYRACAQLFVDKLLALPNGPAHLRTMLNSLPDVYNWQTAFQSVFLGDFPRPLDVEKWWALQVVDFVACQPGPTWTPEASRARLEEILRVPVDWRPASNALPTHAEVSFQAVIRNFEPDQQAAILLPRLRDLELAQLRMAAPFAVLTDGYRRALADYLEPDRWRRPLPHFGKHPPLVPSQRTAAETVERLDALDGQRRAAESAAKDVAGTK